jgi:glycosyltransferase involved in cell wall biosynthesis
MESPWGTGPAKNLVEFARHAALPQDDLPAVQVTIGTYHRGTGENAMVVNCRKLGIEAVALPERGSLDASVIKEVNNLVERCRPDILQSHNIKSHLFVRLTGLHKRYPWIAFHHGYTAVDWKDRLYSHVDRWSLRKAHRVVAVCGPFAKRLIRRGVRADRIRIQHNSVRPWTPPSAEELQRVRGALRIGAELVVLCVGRLSFEKGHADLLQALAILKKSKVPEFRVVLAGEGPERGRLQTLCRQLGIEKRVLMPGHQSDLRPYYGMADLLVLPSHTEGSPNVVLEAMTAGVAVAATRVGGVPEIVQQERTGVIVPPHEPAAMAEAMERLLRNPALRRQLAAAARDHVAQAFTPDAYRRSLVGIYCELLNSADARFSVSAPAVVGL